MNYDLGSVTDSFEIIVTSSPVYEIALGIAAFTWPEISDKLERTPEQWRDLTRSVSNELEAAVALAGQVNTWRCLLFVVQRCDTLRDQPLEKHVAFLCEWMQSNEPSVVSLASPYVGRKHAQALVDAINGNQEQQGFLLREYRGDPLVYPNLEYLFQVQPRQLLHHLTVLLTQWDAEVIQEHRILLETLTADATQKQRLALTTSAMDLIRMATNGDELRPEPGLEQIVLIPQISYRPFTIYQRLADRAVLYYPVQDDLMPGLLESRSALQVANLFKAVGDVNRVRILKLLRAAPRAVTEIGQHLELSKSTAHHHLTLLRSAGLVRVEDGLYTLDTSQVAKIHKPLWSLLGIGE